VPPISVQVPKGGCLKRRGPAARKRSVFHGGCLFVGSATILRGTFSGRAAIIAHNARSAFSSIDPVT